MNNILPVLRRFEIWLVIGLFVLSLAIRWYRLPDFLFFGFEQGRDAFVIQSISQLQDFVLVGPKTDIGGIFHGAWYYYLMAVPYGLGDGSPLVASFFLVALTSLSSLVMYFLIKRMTDSVAWAGLAGVVTAISFEVVSYSRWLSNVTPAMVAMPAGFYCLWRYHQTQRARFFITAVGLMALAAQFEIILALWFTAAFGLLWATRLITLPNWRTIGASLVVVGILFAPMVLFNLRNDFISIRSAMSYVSGEEGTVATSGITVLIEYGKMLDRLWQKTLFYGPPAMVLAGALLMVGSLALAHQKKQRQQLWFFMIWSFMTLPVLLFPKSLQLTQLYLGTGFGLIGWFVLAVKLYWDKLKLRYLSVLLLLMVGAGNLWGLAKLYTNQDVFFITIQDDLNYRDQRALLNFVHQDAQGKPYRLKAFAIPYYQEEGWQYLHQHWYPQDSDQGAEYIYVVIEKAVDPFWVSKWTEELGDTELVSELEFGLLKLEKRKIL